MDRSFPKRRASTYVSLLAILTLLLSIDPLPPSAHAIGATLNWQWRNSVPEVHGLSGVAFGNGQFVAVGWETILTSSDGVNWTPRNSLTAHLSGIAYGGGLFVAVGGGGTILTSSDGADWTVRRSGTAYERLTSVVYSNGRFVAVGYNDTIGQDGDIILTSIDGVDWTARKPATTKTLKLTDVAFGNGRFVAVSGESTILVSVDGVEWTAAQPWLKDFPYEAQWLNGVAYGNGVFVAVGTAGTVLTSTDGIKWTLQKSGTTDWLPDIAYVNGRFLIFGSGVILTSTDGADWIPWATTMKRMSLAGAAFGNGRYVVVGTRFHCVNCITAPAIFTSEDGTNWVQMGYGVRANLEDVAYGNGLFVATGWDSTILTSTDGATWIMRYRGTDYLKAPPFGRIVFRDGQFVAIGWGGTNLTSVDGVNWTEDGSATPDHRADAAYGNGIFVAVDRKERPDGPGTGMILTSKDGAEWTARKSPIPNPVIDIAYGNGQFVALATEGKILTSKDGISWTVRRSGTTHTLQSITFGDGLFVAVGTSVSNDGIILTSSDAVHWTAHDTLPGRGLYGVAYGNGQFVAVGRAGAILTAESPTKAAEVKVYIGGERLAFDVPPAIESERTLVPMRAILEALGAAVEWDGSTRTVTATRRDTTIVLTIGQQTALVNGRPVSLDVPARIIEGRTLVPLRFLSENLGETVTWDGDTRTIKITKTQ